MFGEPHLIIRLNAPFAFSPLSLRMKVSELIDVERLILSINSW